MPDEHRTAQRHGHEHSLKSQGRRIVFFAGNKKRGDPVQERIECLIGTDASVTGDVVFAGGLRIDGHVEGDVAVSSVNAGTLVLGEPGVIVGDVRVSHVIVCGEIRGSIHASGLVELRSTARVHGDLHYGSLQMHAGALVEGYLVKRPMAGQVS